MAMIVRQLLSNRYNPCRCSSRGVIDHLKLRPCNLIRTQTLISTPSSQSPPPQTTPYSEIRTFSVDNLWKDLKPVHDKPLLPPAGSSQVIIRSGREFRMDLWNVEKRGSSAVFYMARRSHAIKKAVAPVLAALSGRFLDVAMYKIVFPKEDIGSTYGPFHLRTLPMFFFYKCGEKVAEVVGPDVVGLRDTFMKLYGQTADLDLTNLEASQFHGS
ncbi:unnamed protein product [Malus baccata var. baccata]